MKIVDSIDRVIAKAETLGDIFKFLGDSVLTESEFKDIVVNLDLMEHYLRSTHEISKQAQERFAKNLLDAFEILAASE